MNIKKPLALLLAAGMTLGLAACGNGSQGNSESPAPGKSEKNADLCLLSGLLPTAILPMQTGLLLSPGS